MEQEGELSPEQLDAVTGGAAQPTAPAEGALQATDLISSVAMDGGAIDIHDTLINAALKKGF